MQLTSTIFICGSVPTFPYFNIFTVSESTHVPQGNLQQELSQTHIQYPPTTIAFPFILMPQCHSFHFCIISNQSNLRNLQQFSFVGVYPHSLISQFSLFWNAPTSQGILIFVLGIIHNFSSPVPRPGSAMFWMESDHRGRARSKGQFLKKNFPLSLFLGDIYLFQPNYHPIQVELAANGGTQCGFCRF